MAPRRPVQAGRNLTMATERSHGASSACPLATGLLVAGLAVFVALPGCGYLPTLRPASRGHEARLAEADAEIYRDAQAQRIHGLEREVARLRGDLEEAEAAMVMIESGLRGAQTRADAVSALAEARISVERARASAPWRRAELDATIDKLDEAERQFQAGHAGSAVFFASRAKRVADALAEEAHRVTAAEDTHVITSPRVNLRSGPSTDAEVLAVLPAQTPVLPQRSEGGWVLVRTPDGAAGWVHASLLEPR
jgi:hypothetical protein